MKQSLSGSINSRFPFQSSEFEELKEKLKKYKSNSTLMRLFNKSHNLIAAADGVDNQSLKSSKPAKVYKRPSTPKQHANGMPNPVPGNETIIESKFILLISPSGFRSHHFMVQRAFWVDCL